jgi:GNAT superfamily N-acetyltransferase
LPIAAVDFLERFCAVDFAMSVARPDLPKAVRNNHAFTFAADGAFHAADTIDAEQDGELIIRRGYYPAPIFVVREGEAIVGAAICSCLTLGIPLRLQMLAVRVDRRGRGIGEALVRKVIASAPIVGAAPRSPALRRAARRMGFVHWRMGASGCEIGFTHSIDEVGMYFVVPVATDAEIMDGLLENQAVFDARFPGNGDI